jgi:RNA polymerase sigma-70 factor, ECF subfamily
MKTASQHDASIVALWRELAGPLRGYLSKRTATAADADDVLQEVFLRVHRQIDTLRDTSKLQGWVYRIARNAVIDHIRSRKSRPELLSDKEVVTDATEPTGSDVIDLTPSLRRFVAELPKHYRDALVRHEFEGQPIREVAETLGISETAAKSRVRRARLLVREMLDRCCRFEFDRRGRVIEAIARDCYCADTSTDRNEPARRLASAG